MNNLRKVVKDTKEIVKVIDFSRNFGKESAIYAGLTNSKGDYVALIDGDLQQDPKYVLDAVNLGNDTDTIGALTGGLAGLFYGYNSIPDNWLNELKQKKYLTNLVNIFNELINKQKNEKAIYVWQTGLGNMSKYLNSENPLPKKDKKANADSWKCIPFSNFQKTDCNIVLTKKEFEILSMGIYLK